MYTISFGTKKFYNKKPKLIYNISQKYGKPPKNISGLKWEITDKDRIIYCYRHPKIDLATYYRINVGILSKR